MLDPETYSIERLPPNHGSHGGSAHGEEKKLCPHIASAAELQSKIFEPVQYVVPGYIAEGATILAGRPKLGKSWLMLDIGLAVARGGYCLGDTKCDEGDVLYLALEDNERRLQSRITKLIGASGNQWPARFYYSTQWPRSEDRGLEDIRVWIKKIQKPRLVVVDVLAAFRSPRKREDTLYEGDYAAVKELQRIASEMEVAIVIVHHLRKSAAEIDPFEKVSGTLGLSGAADTVLVLDRDGNGATLYGRGRDIEEIETAVEFDRRTCRWRTLGNAAEVRRTDERRAILSVLSEADEPMPPKEIMIEAELTNRNAVDILLHKMVKAGEVARAGRGLYWHPQKGPPPGKNDKKQRSRGRNTHKDSVSDGPDSEPSPRRKERRTERKKERKDRSRLTMPASLTTMDSHTISIFPSFRSFGDRSLPFGTWLYAECWAARQDARAQAMKALALMGINPPVPSTEGGEGAQKSEGNPMNQAFVRLANLRAAPRCGARNRAGGACQCPAMRGRRRCRLHGGLSPGAPRGQRNGNFKDGQWTVEAIAERRWLHSLVREFGKTESSK